MELDTSRPARLLLLARVSRPSLSATAWQSRPACRALKPTVMPAALDGTMPVRGHDAALTPGPRVVFFSTPPYHGTLTRFHAHPAAWLHKLPDNVSYEEGSLCEPLAVALAGMERAGVRLGDPVVIWYSCSLCLLTAVVLDLLGWSPSWQHTRPDATPL